MLIAVKQEITRSILIVEDDDFIRKNFFDIFSGLGFQVIEAENGLKASIMFAKQTPDLVITDIHMPVMDGLKLISNIRRVNQSVPIIAISSDELLLNYSIENGANEKYLKNSHISCLVDSAVSLLELECPA